MLILVEGPDLAGKSTLVAELERELHRQFPDDTVNVTSAGPPTRHPLDEYVTPLLGYRPGRGTHVVSDRWHWGERIYPTLLNRPTRYDAAVHRYTELFLQSRGAVVVHATANSDVLYQRHRQRGDNLISAWQLGWLAAAYREQCAASLLPGLVAEVPPPATDALTELTRQVLHFARLVAELAIPLNELVTYVGHPRPLLLLLGDTRPVSRTGNTDLDLEVELPPALRVGDRRPAFLPYPSSSGHFLLRALAAADAPTWRHPLVGILNACDVDDPLAAWQTLGYPEVVTLGVNADRRFTPTVPPHWAAHVRRAPHPQYVRRFHHARLLEYRDQLLHGSAVDWSP